MDIMTKLKPRKKTRMGFIQHNQIIEALEEGEFTYQQIAEKYDSSRATVGRIYKLTYEKQIREAEDK